MGGVACGPEPPKNFSQRPGFAEYFAANPPSENPPTRAERALLERFRPRLFLPPGHEGPIRFYADYIAHGRLIGIDGSVISAAVTRDILNRLRNNPYVVFEHEPPAGAARAPQPVVLGRIDRETVTFANGGKPVTMRFTFLTYHAVFRHSGLPAGMPGWQAWLIGLVAAPDDWHQLDHYTAVTVALGPDRRPAAVTFQQHNYLRTYIVGVDLDLPADGRVAVDVAVRSNELYPHRPGRVTRRAVSMMNGGSIAYLVNGSSKPWRAADDITEGVREVDYALDFLAPADAFYTFQGYLGRVRSLPGRSGPPGADYNTVPRFKKRAAQMLAFHWRDNDPVYLDWFRNGRGDGYAPIADRFYRDWQCAATPQTQPCRAGNE